MTYETIHIPVMPSEILDLGNPQVGEVWLDGTAGGGGHSQLILERVTGGLAPSDNRCGKLLAVDRDPAAASRLAELLPQASVHHISYHRASEIPIGPGQLDGILLDLGLSSDQLADRSRGFSFQGDGELDMRFNPESGEPAWEWLERNDEKTIADAIYKYGEERFSRRIARRIVEARKLEPIRTAEQLRQLVSRCVPGPSSSRNSRGQRGRPARIDPATRTFQALRIVVNHELEILEDALRSLPELLKPGGRILIISFHSLEDRLVKYAFREDPRLEILTRKPVQASDQEIAVNARSRSAKLRVAKRIADGIAS